MSKHTALEIRNTKKKDKPYKLNVEKGLYLHIAVSGFKSWVYRFKIKKKESMVTLVRISNHVPARSKSFKNRCA